MRLLQSSRLTIKLGIMCISCRQFNACLIKAISAHLGTILLIQTQRLRWRQKHELVVLPHKVLELRVRCSQTKAIKPNLALLQRKVRQTFLITSGAPANSSPTAVCKIAFCDIQIFQHQSFRRNLFCSTNVGLNQGYAAYSRCSHRSAIVG